MALSYFSPWRDGEQRACRTCAHAIGTEDDWHRWCERHRIIVVFPCALWEREAGADEVTARCSPAFVCMLVPHREIVHRWKAPHVTQVTRR